MFAKGRRLRGKSQWARVAKTGRFVGDYLLVRSYPSPSLKVGVSVSTSIDKRSTVRNRLKRVLRDILSKVDLPLRVVAVSVRRRPEPGTERDVFSKDINRWLKTLL